MTAALRTLLDFAERERDQALAVIQRHDAQVRRLHQQAEQLRSYHDEYQKRGPSATGRSTGAEMLQVHRGFIARLDEALAMQHTQLQAGQRELAVRREALLALELRVAGVRRLLERRDVRERNEESRREQRRNDEASQQALWRAGTQAHAQG